MAPITSWQLTGLAAAAAYLVGAWLLSAALRAAERRLVQRLAARTATTLDDRILASTHRPLHWVVMAGGARLAAAEVARAYPALKDQPFWPVVENALLIAAVLAVALLVNGGIHAALNWYVEERAPHMRLSIGLLRQVSTVVVLFIAILMVLEKALGMPVSSLLTTAGVASLAVALAAQETLANLVAGFVILIDKPFKVGDVVELTDGRSGEVIEIGLRSTRIRLWDGNALVIPNKDIGAARLINYNLPTVRRAIRQPVAVAYGTDVAHAKAVLLDVVRGHPGVLDDPAPAVYVTNLGPNGIEMLLVAWVPSSDEFMVVRDEILTGILERFAAEGIRIAATRAEVQVASAPVAAEFPTPSDRARPMPGA